ncbi:MAG: Cocaine esterase [Chlamydiae bacterium]|nr:Cocaine esterase [Chlamydiota bacterium]
MQTIKKFIFPAFFLTFLFVTFFVQATEREPDLTVNIPMRDGIELPTDIYLPKEKPANCPAILVRTPSGKRAYYQAYAPLSNAGYVVFIQDGRNFIDKEGKTFPWLSDGWGPLQDGYDTVEWISKSSYSNGKVGTMGFSAMGMTQLLMAPSKPPSLKAQYIGFAASNMYHHAMYMGGALKKNQVEGWLGSYAKDSTVIGKALAEGEEGIFWRCLNCTAQAHNVSVPALHYGGWYDVFSQGTLDAFVELQERGDHGARGKQVLVMGPWTHNWPRDVSLGDFKIPENGVRPPININAKNWFDYHLKEQVNALNKMSPVIYYVMGPLDGSSSKGNEWKTAKHWPVPSQPKDFYFANNDALLEQPATQNHLSYRYNPEDPVPTVGGRNLFLDAGPKDQRMIERRSDVLVFTSQPLKDDIEVTGRLQAVVYVETNKKDTDVAIRLTDVYPDGKSILIVDGIRSLSTVEGFVPGKPVEVEVDLWSTSQLFVKGHRIRVSVSSSNYPQFEKNLNNGGDRRAAAEVAENIVYFGKGTPSRIVLPVAK